MNFPRALTFAVVLYVIGALLLFATGYRLDTVPSFLSYIVLWVLMIPAVLVFAKWYFHSTVPTAKTGLFLGIVTLALGFILDSIIVLLFASDITLSSFYALVYGDWKCILLALEILLLTTYAGYEFDTTYTDIASQK
ncbi:MAG: hypothetical protein UV82_C0008G0035 [Candidatus Magasanikbacteria bacterium GW2011_GWD2_43_18]|uniref:Uncharacterized protein n=1 Tax=Candidatus Magasanikbacteria bacterium GW2011_GWE2_42_7 TaxID=1619052 RepID=A0A0G1B9C1_9BACT|nr:MAG: hypothetical protein UV18_C0002G0018 [Candidatus Magasanikbacteria bacterium GW2011_GWC2_42_27]KKS69975.1 MAG: hypothetical protein UV42_C0072G0005 [Candidatus Magasanikbacteria bacterium GW2011_GWE2_42_7]KKT04431.1 MAG: hypothetical protein UV82_C0008G0035 [Candidatus Magasanikbacteria bacterium GW2011_GWD2_43_18]KKT26058.1 MAG: hypothetical protein UW10_C0002G0058 [Candidatus Magasanikbacteria bacterium GW2011_GWA2_43_9]HBB37659.1 hypothetical protein [Candidatus Magasanikbacteria bac